jgi:hypothetical protein
MRLRLFGQYAVGNTAAARVLASKGADLRGNAQTTILCRGHEWLLLEFPTHQQTQHCVHVVKCLETPHDVAHSIEAAQADIAAGRAKGHSCAGKQGGK